MSNVHFGSLMVASLMGSGAILAAMFFVAPALGLPRLDFTAVTGAWFRNAGRYAKLAGAVVFVLGGLLWTFLYARFWPYHSVPGAMAFALVPFALACSAVLPRLNALRAMVQPLPGFAWVQMGGRAALLANLAEHLLFGLVIGLLYR